MIRVHPLYHDLLLLIKKFAVTEPLLTHVFVFFFGHLHVLSLVPGMIGHRRPSRKRVGGCSHLLALDVHAVTHERGCEPFAPPVVISLRQR